LTGLFVYTRATSKTTGSRTHRMLSQTYTHSDPADQLSAPGVLAIVVFGDNCSAPATPGLIPIGVRSLSDQPWEVIRYGDEVARRGVEDGVHWSQIGDLLCLASWISPADCADIEAAAETTYQKLFRTCQSLGHPYPFRIWNHIPDINRGEGDREEYKRFCVGRQKAFDSLQLTQNQYPAASALGHHSQGAVIYLLAHRQPGQHHENSRQQPAYQYPRQYGPSSPSFARATSLTLGDERLVFVSGTASILGHDTKAAGNLQQQLGITLENIRHLVTSTDPQATRLEAIRVYLRHASDYEPARDFLSRELPLEAMNFLHADICRDNLLVEIETKAGRSLP